jgi:hypothetical protein
VFVRTYNFKLIFVSHKCKLNQFKRNRKQSNAIHTEDSRTLTTRTARRIQTDVHYFFFLKKKALTVLSGHLAYPNGLLDLHIETFGRTPWPGDQPDARPLPTQVNTTQKHADTHPCPKQDSNL